MANDSSVDDEAAKTADVSLADKEKSNGGAKKGNNKGKKGACQRW